jgi:DNA-binding CsgD family transcriptional regulator
MRDMERLVGRDEVLRAVAEFLEFGQPAPTVLSIEGDAGIGKSAVWLHAVSKATDDGMHVLQARASASEAGLAYLAVADLIGTAFDEHHHLVPAPQARALSAALLRSDVEEPVDLRAVATGFLTVLTHSSAEENVLVAVDDVQWLDPESQRVLAFAARRLPPGVRLLLTARTHADDPPPVAVATAVENDLQRIRLSPFSVAALHHLIRDRTGVSLPRPMLTRVARATHGNPLFALEICRALPPDALDAASELPLPIPSSLRSLVETRLGSLSAGTRELLLMVASLARPTNDLVARAAPARSWRASLTEAQRAEVVTVADDRIRFTHPLLASALYGGADPEDRRALHRRLADVVGDRDERARHLAAGTTEPDRDVAAELETAADRGRQRGAQDTAADLFAGAARLTPTAEPDDRARRMLGQAGALNAIGEFSTAESLARSVASVATDRELRVSALSLIAEIAWFNGAAGEATRLAEDALTVADGDPAFQGPIHADLVRFNFSWNLRAAIEHAERALTLLGEERDPATLAHVLFDRMFAGALVGEPVSLSALDRAVDLEHRSLQTGGTPQPMPLLWFHCTDDFAAARDRFTTEERWYAERGQEVWIADRLSHWAVAELRAGHTELAEHHVDSACAAVQQLSVRGPRAMVFEKRALVDAHLGRTTRARNTLTELLTSFQHSDQGWWAALTLSTLGLTEFFSGDLAAADAAWTQMRKQADNVGVVDILFDRSEPFHVETLLRLGRPVEARAALQRLEERGRVLPRPWIEATLPRTRALVLADSGDVEAALVELDAVTIDGEAALPFELGWNLLVKGTIERRARRKRLAAESLGGARDVFRDLGADQFAGQATEQLDRVGLRRTSPGLTPTEQRVAALAARGMTNREIAREAFISQKTVEANLGKVFRKLQIRSRSQLASHPLVSEGEKPLQT